jgi:hypothetical protein
LLDFARIAYANTTICSSSTFCFFAALASNGTVHLPVTRLIGQPANMYNNFHWIAEKQLSLVIWHPWYSIEYGLTKKKFEPDADQEGRLQQGDRKKNYFIENGRKRRFQEMDTFSDLGFDWRHIWIVNDRYLSGFPDGPDMKVYPDKTIKYEIDPVTFRWHCSRCYNLTEAPSYAPTNLPITPSVVPSSAPISVVAGCRWKTPYEFGCD